MSTKPKPKTTKKKTQYVDLNEILDDIATSIDGLADKGNILLEAVSSLTCRMAETEKELVICKTVAGAASVGIIASLLWIATK